MSELNNKYVIIKSLDLMVNAQYGSQGIMDNPKMTTEDKLNMIETIEMLGKIRSYVNTLTSETINKNIDYIANYLTDTSNNLGNQNYPRVTEDSEKMKDFISIHK